MRTPKQRRELPKMYQVRKYIKAVSALDAIKKDKITQVHYVFVDESFKDGGLASAIGFDDGVYEEEE